MAKINIRNFDAKQEAAENPYKEIESHIKKAEDLEKDLKKLDNDLKGNYDLDTLQAIQVALSKSEKNLKSLKEDLWVLKNEDVIVAAAENPIKAMVVHKNAIDKLEKTVEEFRSVIGELEKDLKDPYIREMIRMKFENQEAEFEAERRREEDEITYDTNDRIFEFFWKLLEEGYPQEKIDSDLDEERHLVELATSDKYKQVKAEVEKNLKTPDKLKKIVAETDDPIVGAIVAETLRVTPDMPDKSVKEIVELAENLGNSSHWFVRAKLVGNEKLADGLWFRARDAGNTNIKEGAENTNINIKDTFENFEKLREKLKNDPDWRVRIEAEEM